MSDAKDWTPDGPNCRQCGRHDYALHVDMLAIGQRSYLAGCKVDGCPLSTAQRARRGSVESSRVVSEPGAGITITALRLTPEAQQRLCTDGARIPPASPCEQTRLYTRSECDALVSAERGRVAAYLAHAFWRYENETGYDREALANEFAKMRLP